MAPINLSARDLEVLAAVGKFITTSNVDWDAVAGECGFTSAKRARDRWYPLRDKLMLGGKNGDQSNGSSAPSSAKKTPTQRSQGGSSAAKRKHTNDDTPTKSKRGKTFQASAEDDEQDDEETDYLYGTNFGVKDDVDDDLGFKIRGASHKPDGGRGGKEIKKERVFVDDDDDDEQGFLH